MFKITLSQAIEGYLLDAKARRLSKATISDYKNSFRHLREFLKNEDPLIATITRRQVREFFGHLADIEIAPGGCAPRPARRLTKKTQLNIHTALSALWAWALNEEFVTENVIRTVRAPKPEKTVIVPFSREDIQRLLHACVETTSYTRPGKRACTNARTTALRDQALILLYLDTGARASEICSDPRRDAPGALIEDYDQKNGTLKVMGKGSKERILVLSPRTQKALWKYLLTRPDRQPTDNLITTQDGVPLNSVALGRLFRRLGKRADVPKCHPHRFRHTFAITFLRNGGRVLELKQLLGHSSMEMVEHYATLAQVDLDVAMKRASPVMNWRL